MRAESWNLPEVLAVAGALMLTGALLRLVFHFVSLTGQMARLLWL